jgi:hypothetical protein
MVLELQVNGGILIADSGGDTRGAYAVDLQTSRPSVGQVASGAFAVIGGGASNTASGDYSTVGGGELNTASGTYGTSTVGGGYGNTASGTASTVAGGLYNTASGGSSTVAGGQYNTASGWGSTVGGGDNNEASAYASTVGGGQRNTASGTYGWSTVGGGQDNTASGDYSFVGGGDTNTASGGYSFVGGGNANTASGFWSTVGGGYGNEASFYYATVGGGQGNTASAWKSTVGGGAYNAASGDYSTVPGGQLAVADKYGQASHAAGQFAAPGDAQTSVLVARISTANNTPAELLLAGDNFRCTIASDTTWAFSILVVARRTDADNESAGYEFKGVIDNNAGTTALVGSVTKTVLAEDTAGWDCNVTADDTNDALVVTATGENAKTIYWVARITLVEVTG